MALDVSLSWLPMNLKLNAVMPVIVHSGFTESCLLKVRTYIAESCTRLIFKTRNEKVHDNVALYIRIDRCIHQGIGVNSGEGGVCAPLF